MAIKDWVNKLFAPPKVPPQRRSTDAVNIDAAASAKEEKRTEAAINKEQGDLLRTKLTPEMTPEGTRPKPVPTNEEARAEAEKRVTGKSRTPEPPAARDKVKKGPPDVGHQFDKADPMRPAKPAQDAAPTKTKAVEDPTRELLPSERVDAAAPTGPLEGETITETYKADIDTLEAMHKTQGEAERDAASETPTYDAHDLAARVAEIRAARESAARDNTHGTGGGRTM